MPDVTLLACQVQLRDVAQPYWRCEDVVSMECECSEQVSKRLHVTVAHMRVCQLPVLL